LAVVWPIRGMSVAGRTPRESTFQLLNGACAATPGRDAALIDLSLAAWRTEQLRVFGSISGDIRRNAVSQQVAGGVRYSW
jgi:hypothetical protein